MQRAMYHAGTSAVWAATTAEDDRPEPAATAGQPRAAGGETAKPSPNGSGERASQAERAELEGTAGAGEGPGAVGHGA